MAPIFKNYVSLSRGLWARATKKLTPMKENKDRLNKMKVIGISGKPERI